MNSGANRWTGLDHVRAVAAFMVFTWHFTHGMDSSPVPLEGAPAIPFAALFDEGHAGVALFMCLSGYLFAALLDGKKIDFVRFLAARAVRLFPLLLFLFALDFVLLVMRGESILGFVKMFLSGLVLPRWPSGRWSIAVELQFYLLLPLLLWMRTRFRYSLLAAVLAAILFRVIIFVKFGTIEHWAYNTLVGRIDQFLLGIALFDSRDWFRKRHIVAVVVAAMLAVAYFLFDVFGGFYQLQGWPSRSPIWIVWPAFEAVTFSILIAYYDTTFSPQGRLSDFISRIGFYSYGIYLLHFYVVFDIAKWIDRSMIGLSNFYVAWAVAFIVFIAMLAPSWLAYHLVEKPFQRFKPNYVIGKTSQNAVAVAVAGASTASAKP